MSAMYAPTAAEVPGDEKIPAATDNNALDTDLASEMQRLTMDSNLKKNNLRGNQGQKPAWRLNQAHQNRSTWSGPTKQSVFVFLFQEDGAVYAVRNRKGEYGVPGGKRDPVDRGIWDAARREFREETGVDMPTGKYSFFEWGNNYHSIKIYYRNMSHEEALILPVGATNDPDGEEQETLWSRWDVSVRKSFRTHIAQAFAIYEAVV